MNLRSAWQHWRQLIDGRIAGLEPDERRRMEQLQIRAMHAPMTGLVQLLALAAAVHLLLSMLGRVTGPDPGWASLLALVWLVAVASTFRRLASQRTRAGLAAGVLLAFLVIIIGTPGDWDRLPGVALAGLILLPALSIPLLVRWWAVWAVTGLCFAAGAALVTLTPGVEQGPKVSLVFYQLLALGAGLLLRRSRSDMVVSATASLESAWTKANTDPLTRLLNRRGWTRHLQPLLGGGMPAHESIAVLFIDIDHFKQLNDTLGHAVGDEVLQQLARVVRSRLGGSDVAARLGGEELACLVRRATPESARRLAERLRSDFRTRCSDVGSTISVGIAMGRVGDDMGDLMARADAAMYQAKREGRDQVVVAAE